MKYTFKEKTFTIPDHEIDTLMEKMKDISISEACEVYLYDHNLISDEKADEMSAKASKNRILSTIHGAKGEKKERKAREKKENPLKKEIISGIYDYFLDEIGHILNKNTTSSVRNDEKYIDLEVNGRSFTINLVEHRKKKG